MLLYQYVKSENASGVVCVMLKHRLSAFVSSCHDNSVDRESFCEGLNVV